MFIPSAYPDLIVHNAQVCDSSLKDFDLLNNVFNCPTFMLDQPRFLDQEAVEYYQGELVRLIQFMEEVTKRKLNTIG